jgi:hypothetical protein
VTTPRCSVEEQTTVDWLRLVPSVQKTADISPPIAVTVFPGEIYCAPESSTQRVCRDVGYVTEVDKGGFFAAWEPRQLLEELRLHFDRSEDHIES